MDRQRRDFTWLYSCILLCLFVLSLTSPRIWQRMAQEQASAATAHQEHTAPTAEPAGEAPRLIPAAEPQPLPDAMPGGQAQPDSMGEMRAMEPRGKFAGRGPNLEPSPPPPADRIAPHEEVSSAGAEVGANETPSRIARNRPAAHPEPRRTKPPKMHAEPRPIGKVREKSKPFHASTHDAAAAKTFVWHEPKTLLKCLDELTSQPATGAWATEAAELVRKLGPAMSARTGEADAIVGRLQELTSELGPVADELEVKVLARKLRRAGYALSRRLGIWQEIVRADPLAPVSAEVLPFDLKRFSLCLAEIDLITAGSAAGKAWHEYLLIDALQQYATPRSSAKDRIPPALVQKALKRLTDTPMTSSQKEFVSCEPVVALQAGLQGLMGKPVDAGQLLQDLERYEETGLASDARRLAEDCRQMESSPSEEQHRMATRLQTHYRNANMRVAITADLLNRLMPERDPERARVRDTILGVPVFGQSTTSSDVQVRLLPDSSHVRLALEITGEVAALTQSTKGPATLYNNSKSWYTAQKPLQVDLQGIHLQPAKITVHNRLRLRGVKTDFDKVPLLGSWIQDAARSEHQQKRSKASREVQRKVARKARRQIDSEADARFAKVSENLRQRVLEPLSALSLDPTIISAKTDERRITMRLRLAGEDQLGSHTPRPQAPSDSLISFQIHETAMNNAMERLELNGRTITLGELFQHVTAQLPYSEAREVDPDHEDVRITFAKEDALRVRFDEGRIVLMLSIAKLSKPPRRWKNFQVRVYYRPQLAGRSIELARDGPIHLKGRLSFSAQIALRGVFTRAFFTKRPLNFTPQRLATDPRLDGLAVTQFVIDDGWIGAAFGPQRTAQRAKLLRR